MFCWYLETCSIMHIPLFRRLLARVLKYFLKNILTVITAVALLLPHWKLLTVTSIVSYYRSVLRRLWQEVVFPFRVTPVRNVGKQKKITYHLLCTSRTVWNAHHLTITAWNFLQGPRQSRRPLISVASWKHFLFQSAYRHRETVWWLCCDVPLASQ